MLKTPLKHLRSRLKKLFGRNVPQQLWIAVTYNCQCSCEHCILGPELNKTKIELSRAEIQSVLYEARDLGFQRISYFGGEPLMRADLPDLIKDSHTLGLKSTVYTNGILLTREYVAKLKESGLDMCNVSFDSPDSSAHDQFRHYKGCFNKAAEGINYLVEAGITTSIWTHVSKQDVNKNDMRDLKNIIRLGRELKISHIMVLFPLASGNWLCGWNEILTKEERAIVRKLHDPSFVRFEFPDEMTTCTAGRLFIYLNPYGDVTPCPTVSQVFGNIRKESLSNILQRIETNYCAMTSGHRGDCVVNDPQLRKKINSV